MFGREPAIIAAAIAAIVQGVLIFANNDAAVQLVGWEIWLTPLVTMLAGVVTRQKVVPVKTVKEAGTTPETLKARAESAAHRPSAY